ncbi:hypothetical protein KAU33_04745, partial [Candidatus Dependentiae bacterium]|nr:hypothetical protein [Candidatus Dependentiae bacterium]
MKSYLNAHGHLFLISQDYFYQLTDPDGTDGAINNDFVNNYLHISAVDHDISSPRKDKQYGLNNDPISDSVVVSVGGTPVTNYSDSFTKTDGVDSFAVTPDGGTSWESSAVRIDNSTYKLVFFAFPFENIVDESNAPETKADIMDRVLQWLLTGPSAPSTFDIFDQVDGESLLLNWDLVTNATGYRVEYWSEPNPAFNGITNLDKIEKDIKKSSSTIKKTNFNSSSVKINNITTSSLVKDRPAGYRPDSDFDPEFGEVAPPSPIEVGNNSNYKITNLSPLNLYHFKIVPLGSGNVGEDSIEKSASPTLPANMFNSMSEVDSTHEADNIQPGDVNIKMDMVILNSGNDDAVNIRGTLYTSDSYITITNPTSTYTDLPAYGGTGINDVNFTFDVASNCPVGHTVEFEFTVFAADEYSSKIYFDVFIGQAEVLIVRDDDYDIFYSSFSDIRNAMDNNGITYAVWDTLYYGSPSFSAGSKSNVDLASYKAVVWLTGASYEYTLNYNDKANLGNYLDSGGALLLSSQDYIWDNGIDSFALNYLHVNSVYEDIGTNNITGVANDPITAGISVNLSFPFTDFSDSFDPGPGAAGIFSNDTTGYSGIRYPATGNAPYRTIFLGFPLEAVEDNLVYVGCSKEEILSRCIRWLTGREYDTASNGDMLIYPEWSHDGKKVAYLYFNSILSESNIKVLD